MFSSTDKSSLDAPSIAGRPAKTIEGPVHANVNSSDNALDYLRKQNLALSRFTWTTSQLPGTILFSTPITPLRGNQIISYLAGIYNAWNGGMEYQAKVAGTGFHAGALGLARIPPNIDPSTLKTVQEITAFEYSVIDPKTLEAVSKHISDQRPIMYHYMSNDFTDPNNIGGYFIIFVILQLNTSSTGTNQIDVQVFNKLASDFRFIQIVPPTRLSPVPSDTSKWANLFNVPSLAFSPTFVRRIDSLVALQTPVLTDYASTFGLTNLAGNAVGPLDWTSNRVFGNSTVGYILYATSATVLTPVLNSSTFYTRPMVITNTAGTNQAIHTSTGAIIPLPTAVPYNATITVTGALAGSYYFVYQSTASGPATITYPGNTPVITPIIGESLVMFTPYTASTGVAYRTLTNTYISNLFKTGEYLISSNEAVLCLLTDLAGNQLMYIKIYYDGHITTSLVAADVDLDMDDIVCTFVTYMPASVPIPTATVSMLASQQVRVLARLIKKFDMLKLSEQLS